jgi:hypothetical protein
VIPDGTGEGGPKVSVSLHATTDAELDEIAFAIAEHIQEGVPPSSIAVLLDDQRQRAALRGKLEVLECRTEDFVKTKRERRIDIFDQSVKLLSVASAKGIEFQYIFVPGVTTAAFPATDQDGETADRARRVLYTAMTRCAWGLHLSAPAERASGLLRELERAHVSYNDASSAAGCERGDGVHIPGSGSTEITAAPSAILSNTEPRTTVAAVMQRALGRETVGGPTRFHEDGWCYEGISAAACPTCVAPLHVLRRPYTTSGGKTYRYWAIACVGCGSASELAAFSAAQQALIRRTAQPQRLSAGN